MDQPKNHRLNGYGISESTVRVESGSGGISGAGAAVTPRHIVTCTHVALHAMGLEESSDLPEGAEITVSIWPRDGKQTRRVVTTPHWRSVAADDIALLELHPSEPDLMPACHRLLREDQWGGKIPQVFGYPKGFDDCGEWAGLLCQNRVQDGRIQCTPQREGISKGHSGGPVFSTSGDLLGIAQAYRHFKTTDLKYDYIIPVATIVDLAPEQMRPMRQPYYDLAKVLRDEAAPPPELLGMVRNTAPYNRQEYRLQRRVRDWVTRDIRLDYTPLLMQEDERRQDPQFGEGPALKPLNNLGEALEQKHPAFLLKGAPGCGKTTLLKRLAFDTSTDPAPGAPLPILIELGNHRGLKTPVEWLTDYWSSNFSDMPPLADLSRETPILWLLDGLNELPDEEGAPRADKIQAWNEWLSTQAGRHRAVISCRSADYLDQLDVVGEHKVPHLEVQTLDLPKISEFLHNRSDLTEQQADEAVGHIEKRGLVRLYNTPLMLTLLETVLTPQGDFPEGRAALFSAFLCRLVVREGEGHNTGLINRLLSESLRKAFIKADGPGRPEQAGRHRRLVTRPNPLFDALSEQAYQRQRAEYKGERQEVSFDTMELEDELVRAHGEEQGWLILRAALALSLLVTTEDGDNLRFRHQQFQEFFAARQLVKCGDLQLAAAPHLPEGFRMPMETVRNEMKPWQQLPGVDRSGWEETALMAAELAEEGEPFIADLAKGNLPLAGQCTTLREININRRTALAEQLLARMRDDGSDLRARIAAGNTLGNMEMLEVLGYEAHRDNNGALVAWLPPTERIVEGMYTFGSKDDPEANDDEHRFSRHLDAFELGYFPVTNAEWGCFMEAGGYRNSALWRGEAAQDYLKKGSNEGQIQTWLYFRRQYEAEKLEEALAGTSMDLETRQWVRDKVTSDPEEWKVHLAAEREKAKPVTEPLWWSSNRYNNPLQPVVGISLFESLAYCRWLEELTGRSYTLPDELQWEATARGPGDTPRRYAWEGEFIGDYCNSRDEQERTQVGAPTPVGLYALGRTPDTGLYDMTGNAWEWCRSGWRDKPPYDTERLEQLESAEQPRVVRGGSWRNSQRSARAAARNDDLPGNRLNLLGCRVCVLPPLNPET